MTLRRYPIHHRVRHGREQLGLDSGLLSIAVSGGTAPSSWSRGNSRAVDACHVLLSVHQSLIPIDTCILETPCESVRRGHSSVATLVVFYCIWSRAIRTGATKLSIASRSRPCSVAAAHMQRNARSISVRTSQSRNGSPYTPMLGGWHLARPAITRASPNQSTDNCEKSAVSRHERSVSP